MTEEMTVCFFEQENFPRECIEKIIARLNERNWLVPGYLPPSVGLLSLEAIRYATAIEQREIIILVDRNVASRMAKIAREGARRPLDAPSQFSVDLMALSQSLDIKIEPSIAFYELAYNEGNDSALDELRWFRAADFGQADYWIELANGNIDALPVATPAPLEHHRLSNPLDRWSKNYVVLLKAAELQLNTMPPLERLRFLLQWLISDYFITGPAIMYCAMFFSPFGKKSGMLKQLNSLKRDRAINGIRNAAWDVTYLSELVRKVVNDKNNMYILATADNALAEVAPNIFQICKNINQLEENLNSKLFKWWGKESLIVSKEITRTISIIGKRSPPKQKNEDVEYVKELIKVGENNIYRMSN